MRGSGALGRGLVLPCLMTAVTLLLVGIPLWLVVSSSLEPFEQARQLELGLAAGEITLDNYREVLVEGEVLRGLVNSLLVVVPALGLLLLLGAAAGWVFARATSRALRALYYVSISGILVPPAIITSVRLLDDIGVYGTRPALVLFYAGAWMSLSIFLVTGFAKSIPYEIEESARIDGASTLRVFWSIVLPSLRPVLWTAMIFLVLLLWNDFFYAFFILSGDERATLPLGLYEFVSASQYELAWNLIFADVVVVSLPLLLLYVVAQRQVVAGLMAGAGR
ncbi:MAG: carbohydrate ABC transporter permease [Kineosporiaceae bacterium]